MHVFFKPVYYNCIHVVISYLTIQTWNFPWWRHQMETYSALLAICAGNSPVSGEFPAQGPVKRSFDVFFDLGLIKRLSKQSRGWWFEKSSCPLWRHCNAPAKGNRHAHRSEYKLPYNQNYPVRTNSSCHGEVIWNSGLANERVNSDICGPLVTLVQHPNKFGNKMANSTVHMQPLC